MDGLAATASLFVLEGIGPESPDRYLVRIFSWKGRDLGIAGEVAADADGGWMARLLPARSVYWIGGFHSRNGAGRWVRLRALGSEVPEPGFHDGAPKFRIKHERSLRVRRLAAAKRRARNIALGADQRLTPKQRAVLLRVLAAGGSLSGRFDLAGEAILRTLQHRGLTVVEVVDGVPRHSFTEAGLGAARRAAASQS